MVITPEVNTPVSPITAEMVITPEVNTPVSPITAEMVITPEVNTPVTTEAESSTAVETSGILAKYFYFL
jgi:hypothetical protein